MQLPASSRFKKRVRNRRAGYDLKLHPIAEFAENDKGGFEVCDLEFDEAFDIPICRGAENCLVGTVGLLDLFRVQAERERYVGGGDSGQLLDDTGCPGIVVSHRDSVEVLVDGRELKKIVRCLHLVNQAGRPRQILIGDGINIAPDKDRLEKLPHRIDLFCLLNDELRDGSSPVGNRFDKAFFLEATKRLADGGNRNIELLCSFCLQKSVSGRELSVDNRLADLRVCVAGLRLSGPGAHVCYHCLPPGVATSGGIAAGLIGAFAGFTQPAITAVVTGPASVKLGVDPNKSAGTHAHAGHLGNFAGFTHPTLLAVIATTGITFGWINAIGLGTALAIFLVSFLRMRGDVKDRAKHSPAELKEALKDFQRKDEEPATWWVLLPFLILVVGFAMGYPVFVVGFIVSVIVMLMARSNPMDTERSMLESVQRVAVPLIATIGFLYMSAVIGAIGITDLLGDWFEPLIDTAPIITLILVSAVSGLLTQPNSASAAIILPMLSIVMATGDVNPLAAAAAAAGPTAVMQYFLTGGPVAALATTIPVVPDSDLKLANKFQRPSQLVGLLFVSAVAIILGGF